MSESEEKKTVKVKDSRRVDKDGQVKEVASSEKVQEKIVEASPAEGSSPNPEGFPPDMTEFTRFVMSLAHQAVMFLGDIPAPEGIDMPVDRGAAKQTIDIIAMLEKKTEGNLDATEERFLKEILHSLQMSYVQGGKS